MSPLGFASAAWQSPAGRTALVVPPALGPAHAAPQGLGPTVGCRSVCSATQVGHGALVPPAGVGPQDTFGRSSRVASFGDTARISFRWYTRPRLGVWPCDLAPSGFTGPGQPAPAAAPRPTVMEPFRPGGQRSACGDVGCPVAAAHPVVGTSASVRGGDSLAAGMGELARYPTRVGPVKGNSSKGNQEATDRVLPRVQLRVRGSAAGVRNHRLDQEEKDELMQQYQQDKFSSKSHGTRASHLATWTRFLAVWHGEAVPPSRVRFRTSPLSVAS